ncbi:MAG: lipid II flippase MurJ, partial [Clostridiales bacterium]
MSKNIAKAAGLILIINLVVKVLGFLRETFIAGGFGATWLTDAYLVAYTLPYFLQAILGYALVTVVVPILAKYWLAGDNEEAWQVGSSLINLTAILLTVIT